MTWLVPLVLLAGSTGCTSEVGGTPGHSAETPTWPHLGARFTRIGLQVEAVAPLTLRATNIGRGTSIEPLEAVEPSSDGGRVVYAHAGIDEWFAQGAAGIEHGLDVDAPPPGARSERLRVVVAATTTLVPTLEAGVVVWRSNDGTQAIRYGPIYAFDADRRPLPASIELHGADIHLVVDDATARYPIVIDPWLYTRHERFRCTPGIAVDDVIRGIHLAGDEITVNIAWPYDVGDPGEIAFFRRDAAAGWARVDGLVRDGSSQLFDTFARENSLVAAVPGERYAPAERRILVYRLAAGAWALEADIDVPPPSDRWCRLSIAISNERIFAVSPCTGSAGTISVYGRHGGTWLREAEIDAGDRLLTGVIDTEPDVIAAGAENAVLLWRRVDGVWRRAMTISRTDAPGFGANGLAIDGVTLAVGVPAVDATKGAIYVYRHGAAGWALEQRITERESSWLGIGVTLQDGVIVSAAWDGWWQQAFVYRRYEDGWWRAAALGYADWFALDDERIATADFNWIDVYDQFVETTVANGELCARAADCASGFCVDGVCCDQPCGGDEPNDCRTCRAEGAAGTCQLMHAGETCRRAMGECDMAETCDGSSPGCPADAVRSATATCGWRAGPCDDYELCDGVGKTCPATDRVRPAGAPCRNAYLSECMLAASCDGVGKQCPESAPAPTGTVCRAAYGPCDVEDICTGVMTGCVDRVAPPGTVCREPSPECATPAVCDGLGAYCSDPPVCAPPP